MADLGNNTGVGDGDGLPASGKPGGPPPNIQQLVASKRLQQAQAQVGEVVDIMRVNVEKVLERDQKISELDRQADDLQEGASQFQQQAVKLKREYWWKNEVIWYIIGVVLLVIIISVVVSFKDTIRGTGSTSIATVTEEDSGVGSNPLDSSPSGNELDKGPNAGASGGESAGTAQKTQPSSTGT